MNSSLTPNKLLRWLPMGGLPGGAPSLLSLIHLMADLCFVQCLAFLADPCWWKPWGKHDVWVLVLQYQGAEGGDFQFHVMGLCVMPTFSFGRSFW